MSPRLPDRFDAARLCARRATLEGSLPLAGLERLTAAAGPQSGSAAVALRVVPGARRRPMVRGTITAALTLTCQRCVQPMVWPVSCAPALAVVGDDAEAAALPPELEPLVCGDGVVDVAALVEDELLLALPLIARHPAGACVAPRPAAVGDGTGASRTSPFAVLRAGGGERQD